MTVSSQSKPLNDKYLSDGEIGEQYRYWRLHIMLNLYAGYALFYFTRKNFNYAVPAMITDLGLEKAEIGLIGTLFYITYGCSKFLSGIISDRSNPRYFMGIGLIATGIINIFFGLSSSIVMFAFL
ncbi:MFS transporter, OPA family, sugar phosphate sensor protein UhpC [Xenorhabdus japonica]|uniref:MFS transporter, OPA family, sugar phosphate sensor protein UhpC n=1 Tax=Xenorhabdus japonica TaxID=53341 RepID=A0A1I4YWD2_9GAMM|nr:MFS transporter, OPA family, sugar phosphate sensor protein UhpC [Xenorhabdus japonica]